MRPWTADGPATTLRECGDLPRWVAEWCLTREDLTGFDLRVSDFGRCLKCQFRWGGRGAGQAFMIPNEMPEHLVKDVLDRLAKKAREAPKLP